MGEDNIRLSESYYRDFIEKTAYMIFIADENGRLLHVNDAWKKSIGYEGDDRQNLMLRDFLHPYSRLHCQEQFKQTPVGEQFELDMVFINKFKSLVYTEGKFNCSYDGINNIKILTGILHDVTAQNRIDLENKAIKFQLEEKSKYWHMLQKIYLGLNDESFEKFDEQVNHALAMFGKKVYADRAFIFEYDFEKEVIRNTYEWCDKEISPKMKALQNVPMSGIEKWIKIHVDGKPIYVEDIEKDPDDNYLKQCLGPYGVRSFVALPMYKDGKCYGCIGFDSVRLNRTNADLEKQILMELCALMVNAFLRRANVKKIVASELKIRKYFHEAPMGVFVCDRSGNLIEVNQVFCKALGYSEKELLRMPVTLFFEKGILDPNGNVVSKAQNMLRKSSGELISVDTMCSLANKDEIICFCESENK